MVGLNEESPETLENGPVVHDRHNNARKEKRVDVWFDGPTLREPGGSPMQVKLHDLSSGGFRTSWPYTLRKGATVWLKIPGLEALEARVAWHENFQIGCSFTQPLHPAVLNAVVRKIAAQ